MQPDGRLFALTRGQLDIWLSQATGIVGAEWQLGLLGRFDGPVKRDLLQDAVRQALSEAEPARAVFVEAGGKVYQKASDYSDIEIASYDLTGSDDPAREVRELASSIQRTPMSLAGPLWRFVLFQTGPDQSYFLEVCHHIVVDGLSLAVVSYRIAAIYSALASGEPIPAVSFGTLQDLVDCEAEYQASADYREDRAYWEANLPAESGFDSGVAPLTNRDPHRPPDLVRLDPAVVKKIDELSEKLQIRRYAITTAACALLVRGLSGNNSEVTLDFPVSRRVSQVAKTVPGMFAGILPLVLKTSPTSTVADFCQHVSTRIRELLHHQRFPAHALEAGAGGLPGLGQASSRVVINFIPATTEVDLAGTPYTTNSTNFGPVGHFGFFFLGAGDELSISTAGTGRPFADFEAADLVDRLERVLVAMTADPGRLLSSIDALVVGECAQLDVWGHRSVL
ncbi:MAG: condensation domain-containing protein, partial [Mycolicibacter algericus]|uniref:condensation domain-containing protein n=1 Tax=Mycolicibacter algericus TaxID=1288388 RepID=UPI003C75BD57